MPAIANALTARAGTYWQPAVHTPWMIQYTGTIDYNIDVDAYNVDGFGIDNATITTLHNNGKKVICYFDAGSYEKGRPDVSSFPSSVLGKVMDGWPDEKWLDISQVSILQPIMDARALLAQTKGCDAIDWDNVDGYTNDSGFTLTSAQQLTYNRMLASITHARNMAVGLKNDLDQVADLVDSFDFATNEQCSQYKECDSLLPFIKAGKPVFSIEYPSKLTDTASCTTGNTDGFMTVLKTLDLGPETFYCWALTSGGSSGGGTTSSKVASVSKTSTQATATSKAAAVTSSTTAQATGTVGNTSNTQPTPTGTKAVGSSSAASSPKASSSSSKGTHRSCTARKRSW